MTRPCPGCGTALERELSWGGLPRYCSPDCWRATTRVRQAAGPRVARGSRWSAREDALLTELWGALSLREVSHRLPGRSYEALTQRARRLGLRASGHGLTSIAALARRLGYAEPTVVRAIDALGIGLAPIPASRPGARTPRRALTLEHCQQIERYLLTRTAGTPHPLSGATRSSAGTWGTGRKPARCLECQGTERRHYARGLCVLCWHRAWKAQHPEKIETYRARERAARRAA